jgi:hypothetical protein
MPISINPLDEQILLALLWAAPLTTEQLQRIVAPQMSRNGLNRRLGRLHEHALITGELHYTGGSGGDGSGGKPPRPAGFVWAITQAGHQRLANHEQIPFRPALTVRSLLDHDLTTSEFIVRVIEWTRPILSGIYLERELRIDESYRRPISDGLLIVRYSRDHATFHTVPWLTSPPGYSESVRVYAIETDRNTEPIGVLREKATNYRIVRNDPTFAERLGAFPVVVILAPKDGRLKTIQREWSSAWPAGKWLIATDEGFRRDEFHEYHEGRKRIRTFVDGWSPPVSQPAAGGVSSSPAAAGAASASAPNGTSKIHTPTWARPTEGKKP